MKLSKADIQKRIQELGNLGSVEEIRIALTSFKDDLIEDYSEHENIVAENGTLKNNNETLRKANNSLWLQIGSGKKEDDPGKKKEDDNENLSYEDLFDENGGLK